MSDLGDVELPPPPHAESGAGIGAGQPGVKEQARLRAIRALELRMAGLSYYQVATAVGFGSRSAAYNAVNKLLRKEDKAMEQQRIEYRTLSLQRCERMIRSYWPKAVQGDYVAADRVKMFMEREAKLLGLDAPAQVAITDARRENLMLMLDDLEQMLQGEIIEATVVEEEPRDESPVPAPITDEPFHPNGPPDNGPVDHPIIMDD